MLLMGVIWLVVFSLPSLFLLLLPRIYTDAGKGEAVTHTWKFYLSLLFRKSLFTRHYVHHGPPLLNT